MGEVVISDEAAFYAIGKSLDAHSFYIRITTNDGSKWILSKDTSFKIGNKDFEEIT